jgi:hypothetical protein
VTGEEYQLRDIVRTSIGYAEPRASKYALEGWTALHFAQAVPPSQPYPPRNNFWFQAHPYEVVPQEVDVPGPVVHVVNHDDPNRIRQIERPVRRVFQLEEDQLTEVNSDWFDPDGWDEEE